MIEDDGRLGFPDLIKKDRTMALLGFPFEISVYLPAMTC